MMPFRRPLLLLVFGVLFAAAPAVAAQEHPRQQLLKLVPDDFAFTVVVQDLREQSGRWQESAWLKKVRASKLVQSFLKGDELPDLLKLKEDLHRFLEIDWPTLRDDVLGDVVVLAFRPAPPDKSKEDDGLLMIRARRPELLDKVMKRLNEMQKTSRELKSLESFEHRGVSYFRRVHVKTAHYYAIRDGILAVAGSDALLKKVIDQQLDGAAENFWLRSVERCDVPKSFVSVVVNPRAFDQELKKDAKGDDWFKKKIGEYWQALDAIVFNLRMDETLELRVGLVGKPKDASPAAKALFAPHRVHPLWTHFPEKSIFTLTGHVDLSLSDETWGGLLPPAARKMVLSGLGTTVGPILGLNVEKDLLPNIGPEWGISIFASEDEKKTPQAVLALAVRPGAKAADQALYRGLQFLAGFAIFDYNRNHADAITMQTILQDKVEVKHLVNDKAFPPGFQPAIALKDGYLLLATSPEAVLRFRKDAAPAPDKDENLILRLSATELGKQLKLHRTLLVEQIAERNAIPAAAAGQAIDAALLVFELFDRVEFSTAASKEQLTLIFRVLP